MLPELACYPGLRPAVCAKRHKNGGEWYSPAANGNDMGKGLEFGVSDKWHQAQGLGSAGNGFNRSRQVSERQWRNALAERSLHRAGPNVRRNDLSDTWRHATR